MIWRIIGKITSDFEVLAYRVALSVVVGIGELVKIITNELIANNNNTKSL